MAKQPKLNSLDRYRKDPGRLVLEVHNHCEVPSGCGGVVLRWRNPHALMSVLLYLYVPAPAQAFLDGVETKEAWWFDLPPGSHVLGVHLAAVDLTSGLLMFAARRHDHSDGPVPSSGVVEEPFTLLSAEDGTWMSTLAEPDANWLTLDFDDSSWAPLIRCATPNPDHGDHGWWACQEARKRRAACLGLPPGTASASDGAVWIRKVFEVPGPREHPPAT